MTGRRKLGFSSPLIEGHKGVRVVIVPIGPVQAWGVEPVALDARREGWLVAGTMNGAPFEGWVGHRWGRYFIIVDAALQKAAGAAVGEDIEVTVGPTKSRRALAIAIEQAPLTTAPGRKRKR